MLINIPNVVEGHKLVSVILPLSDVQVEAVSSVSLLQPQRALRDGLLFDGKSAKGSSLCGGVASMLGGGGGVFTVSALLLLLLTYHKYHGVILVQNILLCSFFEKLSSNII